MNRYRGDQKRLPCMHMSIRAENKQNPFILPLVHTTCYSFSKLGLVHQVIHVIVLTETKKLIEVTGLKFTASPSFAIDEPTLMQAGSAEV